MVAPVWFCWDGAAEPPRLYFITARGTHKARNLAAQDWVEAHLGDGDDVVMIRGRATIVADDDEQARVDAGYRAKYVDPHSGATASIHDNPADDLYRVSIERVIAWSYGTVGTWTEWRPGTG
jgi:nitroimidazol reductase NimA-like FMN-containing flavoprotein (pyridoxamine 5'-phosphate oxidase superfamily)